MKIWIKILLGTIAGIITGILIPPTAAKALPTLSFLSELSINIGRYIFFPMIFFSLTLMIFELHRNKLLFKTIAHTGWILILGSFVLAAVGTLSALAINPGRLPISTQEGAMNNLPQITTTLLEAFPRNLFQIFSVKGNFLLPLVIFAFFFGWNLSFDKITTRPAVDLINSLARTFFHMNNFIIEIAGFLIFFCSAYLVVNLKGMEDISLFTDYLLFLTIITSILIFVVYPLLIFLVTKEKNPYKTLFGMLSPSIAAFITGDIYFSLALQIRHNEKNLGINERTNTIATSFFAVLGRSGTALVSGSAFIMIHKAYSHLSLSAGSVIIIILLSFILSFFAGTIPGSGVMISIYMIAMIYNKITTDSYLLLTQIAPLMFSFSALLDSINASLGALFTDTIIRKSKDKPAKKIPASRFI